MKKKLKPGLIVLLVALPFIVVLAWLISTDKISFNLLSKAAATPDYILCLDSATDETCNKLYSGADGLFRLFHDSTVNLDLNGDGQIYVQIKGGTYTLETSALSSTAEQDREWLKIVGTSKGVLIEGDGSVIFDGGAYLGGIYVKDSSDVSISGITINNILHNATTYCKTTPNTCPVGRGIVLDNSKVTFTNSSVSAANNGGAVLQNASTLILNKSSLANAAGIGVTVLDTSTLKITEKSTVSSAGKNAISLAVNAKLVASSTVENNEISRTVKLTDNNGYVMIAQDNASINLANTNVKTNGAGGIRAIGASTVALENVVFTSSLTKLDTMIYLDGTATITSMNKVSMTGALTGVSMHNGTSITAISASDISNGNYGIEVVGGTTDATIAKIVSIKGTTISSNVYGIHIKNRASVVVGEGTIFYANTTNGIFEYTDAYAKTLTVDKAKFSNNGTAITSYLKTAGTSPNVVVTASEFTGANTQTGVNILGASILSVEKACSFKSLKTGVNLNTTGISSIKDSTFVENVNGLYMAKSGDASIYRNSFLRNGTYGIYVGTSVNAIIKNNIFDANATSTYFLSNFKSTVANNVFANSTKSAVTLATDTNLIQDANNVYYNNAKHIIAIGTKLQSVSGYNIYYPSTSTLFTKFTPQITSIKADPSLDSSSWKPNTGSVAINSGNPDALFNDTDGTRNDIGITGGPESGIASGNDGDNDEEEGTSLGTNIVWNFNEAADASCTGGKDVCDSGTNTVTKTVGGHDGKINGGATIVSALNGNGRSFDGKTGTYIDVGDNTNFELQSFTIGALIKKTGTCGTYNYCTILSKGSDSKIGFIFGITGTTPVLNLKLNDGGADGKQLLNGKTTIANDQWYYVTAVVDGSKKTISLYINGQLDASSTYSEGIAYAGESLKIGNGNSKNDLGFNGIIDYMKLTESMDTAEKVLTEYKALVPTSTENCGNGTLEKDKGEACDDGNLSDADGCSKVCRFEADLNKDGKVTIGDDYAPLYRSIKRYLLDRIILDVTFDLDGDGKITINGDYKLFLTAYKYYLKSLLN